jgi:hypothetical protein
MIAYKFAPILLLLLSESKAFTPHRECTSRTWGVLSVKGTDNDLPAAAELEGNNPCWEEFYDDDCAMRNIYSANFVAGKWIKSMPCGQGIEVCMCGYFIPSL